MPNNCFYDMIVRGSSNDIDTFHRVMTDYDFDRHFFRVFSAEIYDKNVLDNGLTEVRISGDCAWSVHTCMRNEGIGCYASDPCNSRVATGLEEESKRLNLEIEIYSEEYGMGFEEHYHFKNGETITNECRDASEYSFWRDDYPMDISDDEAFRLFCSEHKDDVRVLTQDELCDLKAGDFWITEGGFKVNGEWKFDIDASKVQEEKTNEQLNC